VDISDVPDEKAAGPRFPLESYGARGAHGNARMITFAVLMVVTVASAAFMARGNAAALQQKAGPSMRAGYDSAWRGVKEFGSWVNSEVFGR
jgi:hypothetical protein